MTGRQERLGEAIDALFVAASDFVADNEERIRKTKGWERRDEVLEALEKFKRAKAVAEKPLK